MPNLLPICALLQLSFGLSSEYAKPQASKSDKQDKIDADKQMHTK